MLGMLAIALFFLISIDASYSIGKDSLRKAFLSACVLTSTTLVFISEVLSFIGLLDFKHLNATWIIACCLILVYALSRSTARRLFGFHRLLLARTLQYFRNYLAFENGLSKSTQLLCLLTVLTIAAITLIIALAVPPNTGDAMTYHMSRVAHWMANQSLAHYPTSIIRQLDSPPYAGFVILNFQILTRGDYLANLVQWMSFLGSLIGISLIAKCLGLNHRAQVFAVFLCATIPMGILQSSSTQNDYVTSFWLVCYTYFLMAWTSQPSKIFDFFMLSLSLGLALLTKGTAYIYVFPVSAFGFILFLQQWNTQKWRYLIQAFVLGPLVASLLNASHWLRNTLMFGFSHPLGVSGDITLTQNLNPQLFLSNIIKNATLHLVFPVNFINQRILDALEFIHEVLRVDISASETTFRFFPQFQFPANDSIFHEDVAGNLIHFFLLNLCLLLLFIKRKSFSRKAFYYSLCILGMILIYSFFIAWQPWASRLQLSIFVLGVPLIAIVLEALFTHQRVIVQLGCMVLLIALSYKSVPYLFSNATKPFGKLFSTPRVEQYFAAATYNVSPYISAIDYIDEIGCQNVGLLLGVDDYEYPLWAISQKNGYVDRKFTHLDVRNGSEISRPQEPFANFCAIFTLRTKDRGFSLNGTSYSLAWSLDQVSIYRPKL